MIDLLKDPNVITLLMTLVVLSVSLLKIIDFLIKFLIKKVTPKENVLSEKERNLIKEMHSWLEDISEKNNDEHEWLKELRDVHDKTDRDGVPLWYVPRSLVDMQKEIITLLQNISQHQSKINFILETLISKINTFKDSK